MTERRIALIHAVGVAMAPTEAAFCEIWPAAYRMNLLDDSLSRDRARDGELTGEMIGRFVDLARYAAGAGADGVLFTCSAFGPAIEAAAEAVDIPVLKPNSAMFVDAIAGEGTVGLLASFEPSLAPMAEEFEKMSGNAPLELASAPDAMAALRAGDGAAHDRLLAERAQTMRCDTLMLAQFSTARARAAVAEATGKHVLTSPGSAVAALRARLA